MYTQIHNYLRQQVCLFICWLAGLSVGLHKNYWKTTEQTTKLEWKMFLGPAKIPLTFGADHDENMFFRSHLKITFYLARGWKSRGNTVLYFEILGWEVWQAIVSVKERAQRKHVGKDFVLKKNLM